MLVVLLVTLISFSVMLLVPGDPAAMVAGANATEEDIQLIRVQLKLHLPFHERLLDWVTGLVHGDLGRSILLQRPVSEAIAERLPVTLALSAYAMVITLVAGVGLGVAAAVRQNSWIDQLCMTVALLGVSLPNGWLVVGKHAMKNAMIPLVTVFGIILSLSLSGTVVIETVFSLPGMGRLIVNAIQRRDYPVIQGGLLLTAAALVLVNLAVDLLYAWLDPRVRYAD